MKLEQGYRPGEEDERIGAAVDRAALVGFFCGVFWTMVLGALIFGMNHHY